MRRILRMLRTALRPLPRPGVVLSEGWSVPDGAAGMLDPCDCDAWGTEKEHRPETWTHSSDFRPDFKVRHAPCPRWRPKPTPIYDQRGQQIGVKELPDRTNPDAALFDLYRLSSEMLAKAQKQAELRSESEDKAVMLARMGPATDEERAASGQGLPIPPSRPEYRRPAPTPVPSGGKRRSG